MLRVMDHFNATVKDGKLVKTRRGLQVSRQKFNGLSFVNASPQDDTPGPGPSGAAGAPSSAQHEIRFVEEGSESLYEGLHRKDPEHQEASDASQGTRRRRRTARRGKSPAVSLATTPSRPSPSTTPFEERAFQLGQPAANPHTRRASSNLSSPSAGTPEPDSPLRDEEWALFERYFDYTPRCMYPSEDILTYNPVRGPDFNTMVTGDMAAMHCVLMCGSITEGIESQTEPIDLAYHISTICAILNRKLSKHRTAEPVTLHCIATLARVGCYVGRLDHWNLHMRGLQKVLDLNGGVAGLPPWLRAEIFKADLKGAAALALNPYLPFSRHFGSVTAILPIERREQVSRSIAAVLNPLHVTSSTVDSLVALSLFASAIHLARQHSSTTKFDPHAFTEEWQSITHALLSEPGPLRTTHTNNPYSTPVPDTAFRPSSPAENYTSNHRLLPSVPITPTNLPDSPSGPLEPALRAAALLYLKELLPDWPRNLGGYAVLLSLLRHHLRELIHRHKHHTPENPTPTPMPITDDELMLIDPLLTTGDQAYPPSTTISALPHTHQQQQQQEAQSEFLQVVIFLALLGDIVSRLANTNEARHSEADCYPRGVFRDALREVCGLGDTEGVDALGEEGLGFVGCFELPGVLMSGRNAREGGVKGLLKGVVGGGG